jgi:putative hydrolase of the HAD superfamily
MFRAVLFDAAGTVIRLAEPVGQVYARLARPFGLDLEPRRLQESFLASFRRMPPMVFPSESPCRTDELERAWWRELVARTLLAAKAPDSVGIDEYFDTLFRHFATAEAWRVVPRGRETLVALRQRGVRTGIVSNFDHRLHGLLEALRLRPLLDTVVLPSDAGAVKPDPRIFRMALRRIGVTPREALYVGDDPKEDLEGARAAGLTAIDVGELGRLTDLLDRI